MPIQCDARFTSFGARVRVSMMADFKEPVNNLPEIRFIRPDGSLRGQCRFQESIRSSLWAFNCDTTDGFLDQRGFWRVIGILWKDSTFSTSWDTDFCDRLIEVV